MADDNSNKGFASTDEEAGEEVAREGGKVSRNGGRKGGQSSDSDQNQTEESGDMSNIMDDDDLNR